MTFVDQFRIHDQGIRQRTDFFGVAAFAGFGELQEGSIDAGYFQQRLGDRIRQVELVQGLLHRHFQHRIQ